MADPIFGSFAIFSVDFDLTAFRTLQPVGNDDIAFGRDRIEAVFHRALQMVYCIGAAAGIERVAIRQEGFGSQVAEYGCQTCHIVRTDVGQVARFAEMDLDRHKLIFEINVC